MLLSGLESPSRARGAIGSQLSAVRAFHRTEDPDRLPDLSTGTCARSSFYQLFCDSSRASAKSLRNSVYAWMSSVRYMFCGM